MAVRTSLVVSVLLLCTTLGWTVQFRAAGSLPLITIDGGTFADANGDEQPDLIGIGQDGHSGTTIEVALGHRDGTFSAPVISNLGVLGHLSVANFAAAGDVNGDGKLDVILFQATSASRTLFVSLGNGDGTFQSPSAISASSLYSSFALADFNNDGKIDLLAIVTVYDVPALSMFYGNGDGTFSHPVDISLAGQATGVVVADFNNDGKPDFAIPDSSQQLMVFLSDGKGGFSIKGPFSTGSGSDVRPFEMSIAAGDLNNDGKLDVAITDLAGGKVSVLLGNGDGSFAAFKQLSSGSGTKFLVIADVNEDGNPDIIARTGNPEDLSVLLGTGNGTFSPAVTYAMGGSTIIFADSLFAYDFNQDGHIDIATLSSLVLGAGDGRFPLSAKAVAVGTWPAAIAIADFNRDGIPDFVNTNLGDSSAPKPVPGSITIGRGRGDGSFQVSTIVTGASGQGIASDDFNNDGNPDFIIANTANHSVTLFLGKGDGTFQAAVNLAVDPYPNNVYVADVNNDGNADVLVTHGTASNPGSFTTPARIAVLLGNGIGSFNPAQFYASPSGSILPVALAIADYNADGYVDFAVADVLLGARTLYLGDGHGGFNPQPPTDFNSSFWIAPGDFNGDGQPDFLAADGNCTSDPPPLFACLHAFLDIYGLIFQSHDTPLRYYPNFFTSADLDSDAILDAIVTYPLSLLSTLKGNGDGTFQPPVNYAVGDSTLPVAIADVNGDANPDILAAGQLNNEVYTLLNVGSAPVTFPPGFAFAGTASSATVRAGQAAIFNVTITGLGGFSSQVTFSCVALPSLASCNFSPNALTPSSAPASVEVTITTTGNNVASLSGSRSARKYIVGISFSLAFVAVLLVVPQSSRPRHKRNLSTLVVLLLVVLCACGGGSTASMSDPPPDPPRTPAGSYLLQIRASAVTQSGKVVVHIVPVRLQVQ